MTSLPHISKLVLDSTVKLGWSTLRSCPVLFGISIWCLTRRLMSVLQLPNRPQQQNVCTLAAIHLFWDSSRTKDLSEVQPTFTDHVYKTTSSFKYIPVLIILRAISGSPTDARLAAGSEKALRLRE